MNNNIWNKLLSAHVIGILMAVLNALIRHFSTYGLHVYLEIGLKLFIVISGLVLFVFYALKMKRLNLYFSIYPLSILLMIIGWIFRGIFAALILTFLLYPVMPDQVKYEKDGVSIAMPFQGFMVPCCTYVVKERHCLVFEKTYPNFKLYEPLDFSEIVIVNNDKTIELMRPGQSNEKMHVFHRVFKH